MAAITEEQVMIVSDILPPRLGRKREGLLGAVLVVGGVELASSRLTLSIFVLLTAGVILGMIPLFGLSRRHASAITAGALTAGILLHAPAHPPARFMVMSLMAAAVFMLPFVLWPLRRTKMFPLPHMFGLLTAGYLLVGVVFAQPVGTLFLYMNYDMRIRGAELMVLFGVSLWAGVAMCRIRRLARAKSTGPIVPSLLLQRSLLLLFSSLGLSAFIGIAGLGARLGALGQVVNTLSIVGLLGVLAGYFSGGLRRRWLVFVVLASGVAALSATSTGRLYATTVVPLAVVIFVVAIRRRVSWPLVVLVFLLFVFVNGAKGDYRALTSNSSQANPVAAALRFPNYVLFDYRPTGPAISSSGARFAYSVTDLMGYIDQNVPTKYPRLGLTTYAELPLTVVPRLLVPFKPDLGFGNRFGHLYGLLSPDDPYTSENFPLGVEALAAFGPWGVLFVGVVIGFLFGIVARFYSQPSWPDVITGTIITSTLIGGVESQAAISLGPLPLLLLVIPVVARWLFGGSSDLRGAGGPS
jgi:hypothetical protein